MAENMTPRRPLRKSVKTKSIAAELQFATDRLYGNSLELLESLQGQGELFLADVHSDRHIYLTDPAPYLPPQGLGRPRVHYHSDVQAIEVRKWVKKQAASEWRKRLCAAPPRET
jgi:hypothetical protein